MFIFIELSDSDLHYNTGGKHWLGDVWWKDAISSVPNQYVSLHFTPQTCTFECQLLQQLSNHVSEIGKTVHEGQESLHFLIWQMWRINFNLLLRSVESTGMTLSLIASVFLQTSVWLAYCSGRDSMEITTSEWQHSVFRHGVRLWWVCWKSFPQFDLLCGFERILFRKCNHKRTHKYP